MDDGRGSQILLLYSMTHRMFHRGLGPKGWNAELHSRNVARNVVRNNAGNVARNVAESRDLPHWRIVGPPRRTLLNGFREKVAFLMTRPNGFEFFLVLIFFDSTLKCSSGRS